METAAIRVGGWQASYRGQLPDGLLDRLSVERDTLRFADHVGHLPAGRRVWVAELDREIVGFASTGPTRDQDGAGEAEFTGLFRRVEGDILRGLNPGAALQNWMREYPGRAPPKVTPPGSPESPSP